MNEYVNRYWDRGLQFWNRMDKRQKSLSLGTIILTILILVFVVYQYSKTEYAWAFKDMDTTDMAAVKQYLEDNGTPYRFGPDGKSIAVPSSEVTRIKVEVASENLVQNGSQGFGIFKSNISSFGMTDNQFAVLKTDALAGEIQKQLLMKEDVVSSKVLLSLPDDSVFITPQNENKASASVSIQFRAGYRPDQPFIDALYNIVRTSVGPELLPIENISVQDQKGELLPSSMQSGSLGVTTNVVMEQMKIKKEYETDIKRNIENFLAGFFAREKIVVGVVSNLNFDQRNRHETIYEPVNIEEQKGIERSVQEIRRSTENQLAENGGVPATGSADVPIYESGANSGFSSSEESNSTINYEINEIKQSIVSSPYVVTDLTIFAGIEPPDPNNSDTLPEETITEIKKMLVNIVSASLSDNGKTFTIEQLQDKVTVMTQNLRSPSPVSSSGLLSNAWLYALGGAALAIAAVALYFILRRRKAVEESEEFVDEPGPIEFPTMDYETVSSDHQVKKQLESLAKKKPDEFVNLLRTWLVDE